MRIATTIELAAAFRCSTSDINNLIKRGFVESGIVREAVPGQPRVWHEREAFGLGVALKLHRAGYSPEHVRAILKHCDEIFSSRAKWFVSARRKPGYDEVIERGGNKSLADVSEGYASQGWDPVTVVDLEALRTRVDAAIASAAARWAPLQEVTDTVTA